MIKYKGKEYPTRTFIVILPGNKNEYAITISTEDLLEVLNLETKRGKDVDEQIYYYVESKYFKRPAKEILKKWLDEPIKFIREIK